MQRTPELILNAWLSKMKIRVSPNLINQRLKSHPDYPSLLSITDTLDYLGIENTAVEIKRDRLHEISTPFLAHLNSNGGEFVIAENRDTLEKIYPDFFKNWSGISVVIEKKVSWSHNENIEWLQREKKAGNRRIVSIALVGIIALATFAFATNWYAPALMIVALAGIFISWLILSKELGIENKIAAQVCGKEAGCDAIIHSKKGELPLGLRWSDVGVSWFVSLYIILILSSFTRNDLAVINVLSVLSVVSLPFIFFSIYYQWRVAKKWCRLCLITVALLCAQAGILLVPLLNNSWQALEIREMFFIASTILLVSISWLSLKQLVLQNKRLERESLEGLKFKRNESIFPALLGKQRRIDIIPWTHDFQLGNAKASLQLMVACNPYCGPCALAHEKLHSIVEKHGEEIGLTIRFTVTAKHKEDIKTRAVQYMLNHIEQATINMDVIEKAKYSREVLHQWFKLMNYEEFIKKYPYAGEMNIENILKQHEDWMNKSKITVTPTVFINGYELPGPYTIDDLPGLANILVTMAEEMNLNENLQQELILV